MLTPKNETENRNFKRKEISGKTTSDEFGRKQNCGVMERLYAKAKKYNQQRNKRPNFNVNL